MHLYKTRDWDIGVPQPEFLPDKMEVSADAEGLAIRLSYVVPHADGSSLYAYFAETKTWDELRQVRDFGAHAWLGRIYRWDRGGVSSFHTGIGALANLYALTKPTRSSVYEFLGSQRRGLIHSLIVPFEDSPWTDWVMTVNLKEGATLLADLPVLEAGKTKDVAGMHLPVIMLGEPEREGSRITIRARVLDGKTGAPARTSSQVFFETTAGVLLITRSLINDGEAMTILSLDGVPEGIPVKVKAGFKHYPGVHEVAFTS